MTWAAYSCAAALLKNAGIGLLAMAGYLAGVIQGIALGVPAGLSALLANLLPMANGVRDGGVRGWNLDGGAVGGSAGSATKMMDISGWKWRLLKG